MATTTPNFGWSVPTSTDLVKDGATAIETLGDAIDASMADLKGGTTGQVLKKNSNTDMDFVWSADSAGMTNPMTTTGDTIYSSSGSTPARLGIGSSGQVLTVSGGLPTWAAPASGSMTLLSTTSLTGSSTAITSISGSYKNLYVEYEGVFCSATASMRLRPNGVTSGIYYDTTKSTQSSSLATSTSVSLALDIPSTSGTQNWGYFYINDYADADHWKFIDNYSVVESTDGANYVRVFPSYGYWRATTAITSLTFLLSTGTFSGGTVRVYGVN